MEESSEGHSEGNKSVQESNKKRIVKSRAQVEALEKFYEEHKYPIETLKAEFAQSVGLTEKQVSGWFCHRRLKDKKLLNGHIHVNGRQDRSSSILQDRGSGLKQDSCGSTKQGGDRNFDAREVESKRIKSHDYAAAENNYKFGGYYTGEAGHSDDTMSGSSSSQQDIPLHCEKDPFSMASSRSQTTSTAVEIKEGEKARTGPSGFLKVKGQVENAAITAVKKQMGSKYRIYGPSLAVEFDPLPLGAFVTPTLEARTGSYYTEEPSLPRPSDASIRHKNHYRAMASGHNLKTSSHNSDVDGTIVERVCVSDDSETYVQPRLKRKSPDLSYGGESSRKSLVMDMHDDSMIDAPVYESRYPYERVRHRAERMKLDSCPGQQHSNPYYVRVNNVHPETQLDNYNDAHTKAVYSEDFESSIPKSYERIYGQQKGPSKRRTKEVKLFGERITANDDFGSAQAKGMHKDTIRAAKRVNIGPPKPHYRKEYPVDAPSWTSPPNRFPSVVVESGNIIPRMTVSLHAWQHFAFSALRTVFFAGQFSVGMFIFSLLVAFMVGLQRRCHLVLVKMMKLSRPVPMQIEPDWRHLRRDNMQLWKRHYSVVGKCYGVAGIQSH